MQLNQVSLLVATLVLNWSTVYGADLALASGMYPAKSAVYIDLAGKTTYGKIARQICITLISSDPGRYTGLKANHIDLLVPQQKPLAANHDEPVCDIVSSAKFSMEIKPAILAHWRLKGIEFGIAR